jgi:hypothetical protein
MADFPDNMLIDHSGLPRPGSASATGSAVKGAVTFAARQLTGLFDSDVRQFLQSDDTRPIAFTIGTKMDRQTSL